MFSNLKCDFYVSGKSQFVVIKVKCQLVFLSNRSVNYIVALNTRHQHQHGRQGRSLKNMKITIKLVILTAAVRWKGSLSVQWAVNVKGAALYILKLQVFGDHSEKLTLLSLLFWQTETLLTWKHVMFVNSKDHFLIYICIKHVFAC